MQTVRPTASVVVRPTTGRTGRITATGMLRPTMSLVTRPTASVVVRPTTGRTGRITASTPTLRPR